MQPLFPVITLYILAASCQNSSSTTVDQLATLQQKNITADSISPEPLLKPYTQLKYLKNESLQAALGTKSVVFNSAGTHLYAMNLEGMSVYEYDRAARKLIKEFKFTPTKGMGWDYNRNRPIHSFQEKPVEACFSNQDQILWVSLHNAEGIVPIWVKDFSKNTATANSSQPTKPITVIYPGSDKQDHFRVPLIHTGKTPKVIAKTKDSKYLLVSNWHSRNTSVLSIDKNVYPFGKVISTIPVSAIPRGIVVDDKNKKSYIAIMGGSSLQVVDNTTWKADTTLRVWSNPRHLVMDTSGHIFVSYNSLGSIACVDAASGKTLFTAKTHSTPRTIILSKNYQFIFVTCYKSNYVDVYKIEKDRFTKINSLPCYGHPVGVDIFEDNTTLEAWVCSYSTGKINIFSFRKE